MNKFKELRERLRMTQAQISDFLGIPVRTWQSYELGTREPAQWVNQLIIEKLTRYLENTKVLPLQLDEEAVTIYNELDEELRDGVLQPTDTIQAVIIDDRLVDWYYDEEDTLEYMGEVSVVAERYRYEDDAAHILSISVRELMFYIEKAHMKKYGN